MHCHSTWKYLAQNELSGDLLLPSISKQLRQQNVPRRDSSSSSAAGTSLKQERFFYARLLGGEKIK